MTEKNFKEFVEEELIVESRTPKVGIFWIHDGKVLAFTEEAREITPVGGFRNTKYDHFSSWKALGIGGDWTETPRGRVLFDDNKKQFNIITSEAIAKDKASIFKVMREFSLPIQKTIVSTDLHYEMEPDLDWD